MIRERITAYLQRLSDNVLRGRNRSRIVIGTDRKKEIDSGYGDGGQNDPNSSSIHLTAGFDAESGNPDFVNDKTTVYLAGKTDPDDYAEIRAGTKVVGEAALLGISDNVYLKARKRIKFIGPTYSVVMDDEGAVVEFQGKIQFKVGSVMITVSESGIELNGAQGLTGKVITDNDICVGTDPVTGTPILSSFKREGAIVTNQKVIVK